MVTTGQAPRAQPCRSRIGTALVFAALFMLAASTGAKVQTAGFQQRLDNWQSRLEGVAGALESDFKNIDAAIVADRLQQVIQQAQEAGAEAQKRLQAAQAQLEKLGKAPAEGEPAEEPAIANLRQELARRVAEARAHATRADLVIARASELLNAIAEWKQAQVREQILTRSPPPISLGVWRQAAAQASAFAGNVLTSPIAWWQGRQQKQGLPVNPLWLLLLPVAGLLIGWPIRRFILTRFGRDPAEPDPSYARRIVAAFADGLANAIIPVAIILLLAGVLAGLGVLTGLFAYLVYAVIVAIAVFLMVFGLARAALSPHRVQWRIIPVEPVYIRDLLRAVGTVIGVLAIATVLLATAQAAQALAPALEAAFFLIQSTLTALALAWLLTPKYWAKSIAASQRMGTVEEHAEALEQKEVNEPSQQEPGSEPRRIRVVRTLRWLVLLTPFLALAGYGRLTFHLQSRLVATGALVGLALLLRLAVREALQRLITGRRRKRRRRAGQAVSDDQDGSVGIMVYWAGLAIDILLLVPLVYLLLLIYGIPLTTLGLWTQRLLAGVTIGNITVSLQDILLALVVLILAVLGTNLVRRWMTTRLLPNTRLDSGARDSIVAGTSYIGVAIAILLAIAALGIDFSNLALIVGALSLGIGFGLQNVVQNFAAGILLLIERPIKVGDWIVVGATEGTVKRISVRSTEIETFDRSSVFVPNADLISSHLTNWTHGNRIARLILPVRAAYGSDPREVEEILMRCARQQPLVLRFPEPYVWLRGFGESAMDFELRVYIGNTDEWVGADSELYYAIEAAFREAGIVIPFPQRDLHLRNGMRSESQPDGGARPGADPVSSG